MNALDYLFFVLMLGTLGYLFVVMLRDGRER
ncbi:hypothetical protein BCE75_11667 [Isoptericola sp. CG 20/1183]|uniref:Potassium-transporting ATPase subunit F n=1 Tax=Isoptericola halotolerans TaxID=300560 RepID=A0ABX5EK92_9MICO|nr:hypothetical protein BCE75_11667 [Isoptericola sp. CG 20/1183]PRZ09929.1 hypothetical protein BCL65_10167 [Isoptericola halotolerans]